MICVEIHSSKLAHQREVGLPYTVKTSQNVIQHPSMCWIATLRTASAAILIIHESRSPLAGPPGFHTCAGPMRGLWLLEPCRGVVEAALGLAAGYPAILMEHTLQAPQPRRRARPLLTGNGRSCNNTAPAPRPSRSLRGTRTSYRSVAWPIMIGEAPPTAPSGAGPPKRRH